MCITIRNDGLYGYSHTQNITLLNSKVPSHLQSMHSPFFLTGSRRRSREGRSQ